MQHLTAFQRDILYVVTGMDEPYGLAIKAELEEYYEGEINHGRLYPNLDALVEQDLLEKGTLDQRTNSYEITADGVAAIEQRREWERESVSTADGVNVAVD